MSVLRAIACGVIESICESLPTTEDECGPWLAGFSWAFVLHWATLIAVTWLSQRGGTP